MYTTAIACSLFFCLIFYNIVIYSFHPAKRFQVSRGGGTFSKKMVAIVNQTFSASTTSNHT